jgi:hypothetical protein
MSKTTIRKIGQKYHRQGGTGIYLLAQVDAGSRVALIGLAVGNRWNNPIEVVDPYKITEAEWNCITNRIRFVLEKGKGVR